MRGSPCGTRLFFLLSGEREEFHHLVVVAKADDEHGVVLISVQLISNTDATGAEEGNGMSDVVLPHDGVVGEVEGLLRSHQRQGVEVLITLAVVADGDPDLVDGVETDVE